MTFRIITAGDLRPVAPASMSDETLAAYADDVDALVLGALPCLADADQPALDEARAVIRTALRDRLATGGASTITTKLGSGSVTASYGTHTAGELIGPGIITRLAHLCPGARPLDGGMYSVPLTIDRPAG